MRRTILLIAGALVVFVSAGVFAETSARKYTCPMHPEVVREEPGNCAKCGMKLEPVQTKPKAAHDDHAQHSSHATDRTYENSVQTHIMSSPLNIAEPMSRSSSGSSWVPDSTPIYAWMRMFGDDMLMLHGGFFPRYVNANTLRGDDRIDGPNWFMAMYSHRFDENAQLGFRGMMSLDLLTEGGRGYPLLFQTGETWNDMALHDRQHPHDLFDELSLSYSQKFGPDFSAYLYVGYPGEPALGPPAFMHRLSAMDNPDAPLSHHWQDSTHIVFGVVTVGMVWRDFKIEGSNFTGREPDEVRSDFDEPKMDSFSGRLSWNPTKNLALQVSHGYLRSPESLEPDVNLHRTTASLIYNRPLGPDANWSNAFVWGQNRASGGHKTQSFLFESNYQRGRDTVYGRIEHVEKPGHELVLDEIDHETEFPVNAFTAGYVRDLAHGKGIDMGLGAQVTIHDVRDDLERYYGDDIPFTFQVFLRIRPSLMDHSHHEMAPNEK